MIGYKWYNKDKNLVIAESDEGCYIKKEGEDFLYESAIDRFNHFDITDETPRGKFNYIEVDKKEIGK